MTASDLHGIYVNDYIFVCADYQCHHLLWHEIAVSRFYVIKYTVLVFLCSTGHEEPGGS